jgi:transcription elongation factor SPT5
VKYPSIAVDLTIFGSASTIGVIYKTERDSFRVLDQNGQTRLVHPHQISMRRDSKRAIATDSQGYELRPGDNMKEVEGEGRTGTVVHIHQSHFAFLFNREISENGGVFVTRARNLISTVPRNVQKQGVLDLTKQNPAVNGQNGGAVGSDMFRGPKDRLIGLPVTIVKGPMKSIIGIIKDTNGNIARVELATSSRIISVDKSKLMWRT